MFLKKYRGKIRPAVRAYFFKLSHCNVFLFICLSSCCIFHGRSLLYVHHFQVTMMGIQKSIQRVQLVIRQSLSLNQWDQSRARKSINTLLCRCLWENFINSGRTEDWTKGIYTRNWSIKRNDVLTASQWWTEGKAIV